MKTRPKTIVHCVKNVSKKKNKFKRHVKSQDVLCPHGYFFLKEMVLLRLKRATLRILLHVMTMLTKLMCALKVTFSMKVGLAEIKEDDPDDTTCDKRKKTSF